MEIKGIELFRNSDFPRSATYDPEWMVGCEMGPSALCLTEWLCGAMDIKPGMRVLDLGCGMGMSSVFLAKEYGAQVWATDLWIGATDNLKRFRDAGVETRVFPIHAEAHALPYADEFFDAMVSIDAYQYFGTDDLYLLDHLAKLIKPGGQMGIVVPGLEREFENGVPEKLKVFWEMGCYNFHTAPWWRHHWEKTCLVDVECAETLPGGWEFWHKWEIALDTLGTRYSPSAIECVEADEGHNLTFVRMVARKTPA